MAVSQRITYQTATYSNYTHTIPLYNMPPKPSATSNEPKKRALREKPAPYSSKPGPKGPNLKSADTPCTAAQPAKKEQGENLSYHDWINSVFPWRDAHPGASLMDTVNHFRTRTEGALLFNKSTLSRNLKKRKMIEECVEEFPNALSSKRVRRVT
jgi:hypothetical protein